MTGAVRNDGSQSRAWRGLAMELFWANPDIPQMSRAFLLVLFGLIPASYFAAAWYLDPLQCVSHLQYLYGVVWAILGLHAIYAWTVDRPRMAPALRSAIDAKHIERPGRWTMVIHDRTQGPARFGLYTFGAFALWGLLLPAWCFWDPIVLEACSGGLNYSPSVPVVVVGTVFCLVAPYLAINFWCLILMMSRSAR